LLEELPSRPDRARRAIRDRVVQTAGIACLNQSSRLTSRTVPTATAPLAHSRTGNAQRYRLNRSSLGRVLKYGPCPACATGLGKADLPREADHAMPRSVRGKNEKKPQSKKEDAHAALLES
jgi:hypothetical protein